LIVRCIEVFFISAEWEYREAATGLAPVGYGVSAFVVVRKDDS
jgi:hypothetical protein